jgi:phage baseplate assembly protein W
MALKRTLPLGQNYSGASLLVSSRKISTDLDFVFAAKPGQATELVTRENYESLGVDSSDIGDYVKTSYRGDVYKKIEAAAVKQALVNLCLTNHYDKPFEPYFGANLRALLFENMESTSTQEIEDRIKEAIRVWEPRVTVVNVDVFYEDQVRINTRQLRPNTFKYDHRSDRNSVSVAITFSIKETNETETVNVQLSRLR